MQILIQVVHLKYAYFAFERGGDGGMQAGLSH